MNFVSFSSGHAELDEQDDYVVPDTKPTAIGLYLLPLNVSSNKTKERKFRKH